MYLVHKKWTIWVSKICPGGMQDFNHHATFLRKLDDNHYYLSTKLIIYFSKFNINFTCKLSVCNIISHHFLTQKSLTIFQITTCSFVILLKGPIWDLKYNNNNLLFYSDIDLIL